MKHTILHPENWALLDDLHNALWRQFPMDRFEFCPCPHLEAAHYDGTATRQAPLFSIVRNEPEQTTFLAEIDTAVRSFLGARLAA